MSPRGTGLKKNPAMGVGSGGRRGAHGGGTGETGGDRRQMTGLAMSNSLLSKGSNILFMPQAARATVTPTAAPAGPPPGAGRRAGQQVAAQRRGRLRHTAGLLPGAVVLDAFVEPRTTAQHSQSRGDLPELVQATGHVLRSNPPAQDDELAIQRAPRAAVSVNPGMGSGCFPWDMRATAPRLHRPVDSSARDLNPGTNGQEQAHPARASCAMAGAGASPCRVIASTARTLCPESQTPRHASPSGKGVCTAIAQGARRMGPLTTWALTHLEGELPT
ncbi:hypothetical protein WA016_05815 [Myxococcus stipitatus]